YLFFLTILRPSSSTLFPTRRSSDLDLILFADTGGEKPETYAYLDVIRRFLARVHFPDVIVVRYRPKWAPYHTLEEQCLHTGTLPDRKSTRLNSSHVAISYAVFCLKK